MTAIQAAGWTVFTLSLFLLGVLFFSFIIKPKQNAKNKAKQAEAERKYLDMLLSEAEPEIYEHCFNGFKEKKLTAFN